MQNLKNWESIIEQQEQSGLSASEYCRMNTLSVSAFYKARAILRQRSQASSSSLVPLAVVPSKQQEQEGIITVCFPTCKVKIPSSLPLAVIKELLSISRESLCS